MYQMLRTTVAMLGGLSSALTNEFSALLLIDDDTKV